MRVPYSITCYLSNDRHEHLTTVNATIPFPAQAGKAQSPVALRSFQPREKVGAIVPSTINCR